VKITSIVTHGNPHADELVSEFLLRSFKAGEKKYPGVSTAKRENMHTCIFPAQKTFKDFPERLFLGCGLSPLDEHSLPEGEACLECTATLVAKDLGLFCKRGLQKILRDVLIEDRYGLQDPREIAFVIKLLHRALPDKGEKVYEWAMTIYNAIYQQQAALWEKCREEAKLLYPTSPYRRKKKQNESWEIICSQDDWIKPVTLESGYQILRAVSPEKADEWIALGKFAFSERNRRRDEGRSEFLKKAFIEEIFVPGGKAKMATIITDNDQVRGIALQQGIALLIKQDSNGNVQIFCAPNSNLDLREVAHLCRYREQEVRGRVAVTDPKILTSIGMIPQVPFWHLMDTARSDKKDTLLNGSLTASMVEPTALSLQEIGTLVKIGINPETFQADRFRDCRRCICTSTKKCPCPWFKFKLHRCRKVRNETSSRKAASKTREENLPTVRQRNFNDPALEALFSAFEAAS
jgi:hypothetical protein